VFALYVQLVEWRTPVVVGDHGADRNLVKNAGVARLPASGEGSLFSPQAPAGGYYVGRLAQAPTSEARADQTQGDHGQGAWLRNRHHFL